MMLHPSPAVCSRRCVCFCLLLLVAGFCLLLQGTAVNASLPMTGGSQSVDEDERWWDGFGPWPDGQGMNGEVHALTVYEGCLIAGGEFTEAGGVTVNHIARWDGDSWSPLGPGMGGGFPTVVYALAVYGGDLIAGGRFTQAGGVTASRVARWDGDSWSPMESGISGVHPYISALTVWQGNLVAGGFFTEAGGVSANNTALWDGVYWAPIGSGTDGKVSALAAYGEDLIAGGVFTEAGGVPASRIALWNGSSWSSVGSGMDDNVEALAAYSGHLIAGGAFSEAGGISAARIAGWDGDTWFPLESGTDDRVSVLTVLGDKLLAGGRFTQAGGVSADHIGFWDGIGWICMGSGTDNRVRAIAEYNSNVYAGGDFAMAGGKPSSYVARWQSDISAPAAIMDLAVTGTTDTSLVLAWTAVGDDSTTGQASEYDLRLATSPMDSAGFALADTVAGCPDPQPAGSLESLEVTGLHAGIKYYFALKTADEDRNWSDVSNCPGSYTDLGAPVITGITDVPNDQGKRVLIEWDRSETDQDYGVPEQYVVTEYGLWRWVESAPLDATLTNCTPFVMETGRDFRSWYPNREAMPLVDIRWAGFGQSGAWLYLGSVPAQRFESYSFEASTLADSTAAGIPYFTFFVSAMTDHPFIHAESPPDSGYSVDNLPPGAPVNLTSPEPFVISWDANTEEDLDFYSVYADVDSIFVPTVDRLVGSTVDPTHVVPDTLGSYYVGVTATDFNGNESALSSTIGLVAASCQGWGVAPQVYRLGPTSPNPFSGVTRIQYEIPAAFGTVTITVFDVNGRHIRTLVSGEVPPGRHSVTWNGHDTAGTPAAPGLYFIHMTAENFREVKKIVLME